MPSTTLEPHAIGVLAGTPSALRAMLGALPDHAVETPADEGWSPRDVVPTSSLLKAVAGEISLADLVHHRAYHDTLHIAQVATMLQDRLDPLRGNMQAF